MGVHDECTGSNLCLSTTSPYKSDANVSGEMHMLELDPADDVVHKQHLLLEKKLPDLSTCSMSPRAV